ncbi:MAG: nucleoside-diphosphate sugar epimerase/dehydratase [Clostridiales bacterium]|jgi:FlaA1/EpsC-like NDP-sugar epimerase|nr:polysaccharide biosynthesis protein [Eubacteriales bacterium]MDH7565705.1 nucleoside-diphosphate sugar epimerase/dehydratase [Clostridiales bacterium]
MQQKIRSGFLAIFDIALINISVALAYLLRFDGDFKNIPPELRINFVHLAIAATAIKIVCYIFFRLYSSLWKYASIYEMISIVGAAFVSNAIVLGFIFIARLAVPRSIFIITIFIDTFLIGGVRFSYRIFRRLIRGEIIRFKGSKRVLIVGGGEAGAIIIKELNQHAELNSIPVAIIDDDKYKQGRKINGVPILGQRKDIVKVVEKKRIDEIIIAIPSANKKNINEIYDECAKTDCKVKILPSVSELIDESVIVQKIRDVNIEDLLGRDPIHLDVDEIASYLTGKVVLVTGGGGSIGSELCRQIAGYNPKQLIILDNYENNAYDIQNELLYSYPGLNLATVIANIREKHRMDRVFSKYKPDVVFHAAAHKHVPLMEANPTEAIKNNVFGTLNVAECADKYGVGRFVLISTDKAVNPTNIMGATKRMAEMIIQGINRHSKTEFVAVRFGNVLGSNGSVIPLFKRQIEQGGPVTVTHPEVIRYFMTIPEAVQLVIQAGAMAKGGEIFVLDMGQPVKIYDLAKNLIRLSGFEPDLDIKIEFTGLRPGEKLYEELLLAEEGMQATKNDKIFVAQPVFTDLALLKREIDYLKEIVMTNGDEAVDYIQTIVPTYRKAERAGGGRG